MSKKDNFSQAAYEMFGIGKGGSKPAEKPAESAAKKTEDDGLELTIEPTAEVKPLEKIPEKPKTTLLAEGSVFEGTLHTKGDVEIAGVFKGDIFSDGNVKLFADIEGNVQGGNVELVTSNVQGDVSAKDWPPVGRRRQHQDQGYDLLRTHRGQCGGQRPRDPDHRQRPHRRPDCSHHRCHGGRSDGGPLQDREKIICGYTGQIFP